MIEFLSRRRRLAAGLCALLAAGLVGCGSSGAPDTETQNPALLEDATFTLTVPETTDASSAEPVLDGQGALIAYVAGPEGAETGTDAAGWRGVQAFADTFGYTAQLFTVQEDTPAARQEALRAAAESGAPMVVCHGEAMAVPVFEIQRNYPSTAYLLLDAEPHNEDYTLYETASNTHCVLYNEEQAGYLAGYAAVMEGYTALGFIGADSMPETASLANGMLQGAEAAAERQGQQVRFEMWYVGSGDATDEVTARVGSLFADGVQVVMADGGDLLTSCIAAAENNGGQVMGAGWDASSRSDLVLTSALENDSIVVQNELYSYFTQGGWGDAAGTTERMGAAQSAISLPLGSWKFRQFTTQAYQDLYTRLYEGTVRVERYPDTVTLPDCPNVALNIMN